MIITVATIFGGISSNGEINRMARTTSTYRRYGGGSAVDSKGNRILRW